MYPLSLQPTAFMKAIGAAATIGGCSLLGNLAASALTGRVAILTELQRGFRALEAQISYSATCMPEALATAGEALGGEVGRFFTLAGNHMKTRSVTSAEAWTAAFDEALGRGPLEGLDRAIVLGLGKNLGMSDRPGQVENLRFALDRLRLQETQARERETRSVRMYRYLGVLTGVALALILC